MEFGSGNSTPILGKHCGKVYSLEHLSYSQAYAIKLARQDSVHVRLCDIGEIQTPDGPKPCYRTIMPEDIDFVLIDGPPESIGRAGTLFQVWPYLSEGAVILLDDQHRPGEQAALELWRQHMQFSEKVLSPQVIELQKL